MRRDPVANTILDGMIKAALSEGQINRQRIAQKAYWKIAGSRRHQLAVSRLEQQIGAKLRRRRPKLVQPIIPGLLNDA